MIKTSSGTTYYSQKEMTEEINKVMEDGYKITNAIYEEARNRNWCQEYDDWAEQVNKDLKYFEVPSMYSEYAVTYTIERTQTATVTVQVSARDEDNAEDNADDEYNLSDLTDKIDGSEWKTINETIDTVEAQEI